MLAARRPEAAARSLLEALGSITSCVASERLSASPIALGPNVRYEIAYRGATASLRAATGGPSGLTLDPLLHVDIVEAEPTGSHRLWRAALRMYQHRLLDHDERELLVYHWQPGPGFRGPDHPHLHVSASLSAQISAIDRQAIDLDKLHLATGRVSLASVVRMLITEFGIGPRRHDWAATLDRTERDFQQETGPSA